MLNFCDGFDSYAATADLLKKWDQNDDAADITFSAGAGRYGGGALVMNGNGGADTFITRVLRGTTGSINIQSFAFAFRMSAAPTAETTFFFCKLGDQRFCTLTVRPDGNIGFRTQQPLPFNNTATNLSTGVNIANNVWHWIEFKVYMYAGNSWSPVVWVNGVSVISPTFFDSVYHVSAFGFRAPHEAGAGKTITIDDVITYDQTAETNGLVANSSEPIGDHRIGQLNPTGAGASAQFTPSASTNVSCIDEAVANDDTDFNTGSTVGHRDTFVHSDLAFTPVSVTAVVANMRCRTANGGVGSIKAAARSSATNGASPAAATPKPTYSMQQAAIFRDPNGNIAWTGAAVNAAEFGYELA